MPVVQIDWTSIKALFGDVTEFIALTSRQRALLLSLTEQLTWRKTFDDFGYDWADKDALDLEIADLERNLTMPVVLSDLIGYIDEIEELLRALNSTANCCGPVDVTDGDQYTDVVDDGTGSVPQNIIDAGYASGTSDWTGFADYKCMISHVMVDDMEASLRAIHERFDDVGVIIGGVGTVAAIIGSILAAVATGGVTLLLEAIAALGAASAVWGGLTELGDVAVESLADKIATYHDDLACAIYFSDGSLDSVDNLRSAIDTYFTASEALILKNMNLGPKLKGLYAGRYDQQDIAAAMADNGFDPDDYDCSCPAGDHYYLAVFASNLEQYDANGALGFQGANGNPAGCMQRYYYEPALRITNGGIQTGGGTGTADTIRITKVTLDWYATEALGPSTARLTFDPLGTPVQVDVTGLTQQAWTTIDFIPASPVEIAYNDWAIYFSSNGGTAGRTYFDNVKIWYDTSWT